MAGFLNENEMKNLENKIKAEVGFPKSLYRYNLEKNASG